MKNKEYKKYIREDILLEIQERIYKGFRDYLTFLNDGIKKQTIVEDYLPHRGVQNLALFIYSKFPPYTSIRNYVQIKLETYAYSFRTPKLESQKFVAYIFGSTANFNSNFFTSLCEKNMGKTKKKFIFFYYEFSKKNNQLKLKLFYPKGAQKENWKLIYYN